MDDLARRATKDPKEVKPEDPHPNKYARFIRLLSEIVAAIYELDPRLWPKPRPITGEGKDEK